MNRLLFSGALIALTAAPLFPVSSAPLARTNVVLESAKSVDLAANTATLPLYRGTANGAAVWYIITDASDSAAAKRLGVLYAPLIANAGAAIESASGAADALKFTASVNFKPARKLTTDAGGNPTGATPGSVGDAGYSPIVRSGGIVYNAPIVASGAHPHDISGHTDVLDRVVAIDTSDVKHATVTLVLARGFTNGQPIAYISTDASDAGPAAIERSTFAPKLKKLTAGSIPIDVFFNGPKQGIPYAALHGNLSKDAAAANAATIGSPLNIQATFPAADNSASGYSPLWNVFPAVWSDAALAKAGVVTSGQQLAGLVSAKSVTGPKGAAFGAPGITVDCPVVAFAEKRP